MGNKNKTETVEDRAIILVGNPTTGYTWCYSMDVYDVVELEEEIVYLGDDNIDGAPSRFTYDILPKKQGAVVITFLYRRPWLPEDEYIERKFYIIEVNEKLDVSVREGK